MQPKIFHYILTSGLAFACASVPTMGEKNRLVLEAKPSSNTVLKLIPLVVKLEIHNISNESVALRFSSDRAARIGMNSALVVTRGTETQRLTFVGGPRVSGPALPAVHPLAPGGSLVVERIFSLIKRTAPARGSTEHDNWHRYKPLESGTYLAHVEFDAAPGQPLISNEFSLTIVDPDGANAEAPKHIAFRHVSFLEGRDVPPDPSYYHGGKWWRKVDVSRFQEIQKIVDDFPDSEYAKWIRFWKVYHHGSENEALQYARTHPDFPLSDNLMFRVITRVAEDDGRHDEAVSLLAELERVFPNGDTALRAKALRKTLVARRDR